MYPIASVPSKSAASRAPSGTVTPGSGPTTMLNNNLARSGVRPCRTISLISCFSVRTVSLAGLVWVPGWLFEGGRTADFDFERIQIARTTKATTMAPTTKIISRFIIGRLHDLAWSFCNERKLARQRIAELGPTTAAQITQFFSEGQRNRR